MKLQLAVVFDPYTFAFIAIGNTTRLSFRDIGAGTFETDGLLDNVTVSSVPTPSALWLLGAGVAILAGRRNLRHKSPDNTGHRKAP